MCTVSCALDSVLFTGYRLLVAYSLNAVARIQKFWCHHTRSYTLIGGPGIHEPTSVSQYNYITILAASSMFEEVKYQQDQPLVTDSFRVSSFFTI